MIYFNTSCTHTNTNTKSIDSYGFYKLLRITPTIVLIKPEKRKSVNQGDHWVRDTLGQTRLEIQPEFSQTQKLSRNLLKLYKIALNLGKNSHFF